ncbi:hypothetical protein MIMGU_mgv1a015069mg [Erythranthe guttata]|uniref:Uncharacterized protein n=1 Tax=Erythranthe guttata TaxID=4155 RepID=A0A022QKK5_ERYGU|nr:hypothetical protein MIMGU_mgv1a015069mg [Erythranthe guttata]
MNCCESGDGMNKVPKLDGVPAESGECSVNKTKTKKKRKRVGTSADNKTKHTKLKSKKQQPKSTVIVINVLYDVDSTRCDGKTWKILDEFTNFALSLYNRTHYMKYNLMELLRATGDLSMVDLMFRAKPRKKVVNCEDPKPQIFRARVSITHRYVVFVEIVLPADFGYLH